MTRTPRVIKETRSIPRMQAPGHMPVIDQMTDRQIGQLGNISENGLLLITSESMQEDSLYQLRFTIPDSRGNEQTIDVGAHLLWCEPAQGRGNFWAGFRFLTLSQAHAQCLHDWMNGLSAS